METLIFLIGVTAIVAINSLVAFVLGWLFTEKWRLPLRFKPFNCRPCLTFWLTAGLNFIFAWIVAPYFLRNGLVADRLVVIYGVAGVGVLLGLLNFIYIKLKFQVYD